MSEAALTIADIESLVFEPLKKLLETTRNLTAFVVPRLIENAGPKLTEHELPVGLQDVVVADPHVAFVFASTRVTLNAVAVDAA